MQINKNKSICNPFIFSKALSAAVGTFLFVAQTGCSQSIMRVHMSSDHASEEDIKSIHKNVLDENNNPSERDDTPPPLPPKPWNQPSMRSGFPSEGSLGENIYDVPRPVTSGRSPSSDSDSTDDYNFAFLVHHYK